MYSHDSKTKKWKTLICQVPTPPITPQLLTVLYFLWAHPVSLCINKPIQLHIFLPFYTKSILDKLFSPFFFNVNYLRDLSISVYRKHSLFLNSCNSISLNRGGFIISPALDIWFVFILLLLQAMQKLISS